MLLMIQTGLKAQACLSVSILPAVCAQVSNTTLTHRCASATTQMFSRQLLFEGSGLDQPLPADSTKLVNCCLPLSAFEPVPLLWCCTAGGASASWGLWLVPRNRSAASSTAPQQWQRLEGAQWEAAGMTGVCTANKVTLGKLVHKRDIHQSMLMVAAGPSQSVQAPDT